ncbi:hypothetical protein APHCRT_0715 [Anaplasma phagocytophilum str. CRT53-1]|uniref:Uncharacterized protein n=1 Tax=Anaplasma phagocytophilum str. CRT53-1 TaxID=1359157 RepID=A0A0F3Q175_ANAPH|nr:hypothetical protein APHCRT_0715 [Anaplasma phagocytophilum str. CRT53-1]
MKIEAIVKHSVYSKSAALALIIIFRLVEHITSHKALLQAIIH